MTDFIFLGPQITEDGDYSHEIKRYLLLGRKVMTNLDSILNSRDITLLTKDHIVKAFVFPVVIQIWELDHKGWTPKNWCCWSVVLEKNLENSLDFKEIKPVNPKGSQPWILIGRTWKDWRQKEKGAAEDDTVEWHHELNGHVFEQTLGDSEGQWKLACCSPGVAKNRTWLSDWTTTWDHLPISCKSQNQRSHYLYGISTIPWWLRQ